MADQDVSFRGTLQMNTVDEVSGHRLNNVTVEVDLSDVEGLDESLDGQPVDVEGHFEAREHPETGTRWILRAHSATSPSPSDRGSTSSAPPRSGS